MKNFTRLVCCVLLLLASTIAIAQPIANFTATPVVGCAPLLVQFTSTSTGNPTTYQWNLGNSATSAFQNPSTTYTIPGTYTVTLTVSNASGTNTKTVTNYITVLGSPIVGFTVNDTASCPPLNAIFTNTTNPVTPGAATYSWSFGDGNLSTLQNPSHTYPYPGYYNVTLVATNSGGCISSLTLPNIIHVYTPPVADFAAPFTQCNFPASVTFTPNIGGSGPFTYNWNFGDGNTGTGSSPTNTYTSAGSYTVQLIVTDVNGCKDTVIKPNYIVVGTLGAGFTTTPSAGCVNTPFQVNSTSVNATSYLWDFGDGGTDNVANPAHVYTAAGTYNVKLKVMNSSCSDSVTIPVTIYPQPDAVFSHAPLDPCPAPANIQFTNLSTGAVSYAWTFGDGGTSSAVNPSHNYTSNYWYTVQLIATSADGCLDTATYVDTVKVYDLYIDPKSSIQGGCLPLEIDFWVSAHTTTHPPLPLNVVTDPYPYPIVSWFWDFRDGNTSTLDSPTHIYTVPGVYNVLITATTANGCVLTDSVQVMGGFLPDASFLESPDTICLHDTVHFVNTSTNTYSYSTYSWYFGDTLFNYLYYYGYSNSQNPSYVYDSLSGLFNVMLVVDNYGCLDSMIKVEQVLVHPPTGLWSAVYSCDTPLKVKFYDTLSIQPTSLVWYFGDGTSSTASNPVHTYPALGTYTVTLVTFNNIYGCMDSTAKLITLLDPVLTFVTPDTAICRGDSIDFYPTYTTNPVGPYTWKINNQFLPPPTGWSNGLWGHRFNQNGVYKISVSASDQHGCVDSFSRTNYILVAKPTAQFTASPNPGCVPLNVLFTDVSTNTPGAFSVTREWDFGNTNTATVTTATTNSVYNNAGLYTVRLLVTDNVGCKDTLVKTDYIDARQPVANFVTGTTQACIGQNILFSNTSSGTALSAAWDFGDGTTTNIFSPAKAYSQTGTYTVRLIVTDPTGCKDTAIFTNHITISKPNAAFTMSDTFAICPPLNVIFTNLTTGATSYAWDFGNTASSTLQNPSAIYTNPGQYNITMIATNSIGCKDTAYGHANVLGYAGGLSYSPLSGCAPLTVQFTATLTNVPTIIWDFSDGSTSPANGASTTTHTYLTPGWYVPKLILSDGAGCLNSSSGIDTIKVDGVYAGFITSPACEKTLVQFQDTSFSFFSPVTSWSWSFNNGQTTSNLNNPTNFYNTPGTYPVVLIATNANGCADTLETNLTIYELPVISAGLDTIICAGDAAQLTGTGGVSYVWDPVTGLSCTNCASPSASPPSNMTYIVTGTDSHGCENTDTVQVNLQYVTTSAVGEGGDICNDSTFQLSASGAHRYEWKPTESLNDGNIPNPVASPHVTTIYTMTAWEGSCPPDSHKVEVVVYPRPIVNAGGDETIVAGGKVMLNATGSNISTFSWSPTASLTCENCSNPTASPTLTTDYIVLARSKHGCKTYDTVRVSVLCDNSQLFIPNYFSPDGDGNNDIFYPRGEGLKNVSVFRIYNRWGTVVFERTNINLNDASAGWDGKHKGQELNPDVFVYLIQGTCESGEMVTWKGDITLSR